MLCTFLANCGLLLQSGTNAILIDAPNGLHTSFDGLSEEEQHKMAAGTAPYDGLRALFFTHKHSDHYDKKRVREITDARENVFAYVVNGVTPSEGVVQAGPFTVHYFDIGHSGDEFADVFHRVLLVEAEGKKLYVTGDADWKIERHLPILQRFMPDAAVWNPNYLSHEEGRKILQSIPQNYIYHLPVLSDDVFGFDRKCRREFLRHGDVLNCRLVDSYPQTVEI